MNKSVFDDFYKNLNEKQRKAVDTIDGPVMVVAGPGTGKTTILTLRIANILLKTDVQPENILALTFTNSGVFAMRKRLREIIGDDAYRVNIFTFHSFAEHVIKEFPFYFKELEFSNVVTDLEKVYILEEIISKNKFKEIVSKHDPFSSINQITKAINSIKQEGLDPKDFFQNIPKWHEEMLRDENIYYKRKFGKHNIGDIKPSEKEKIDKKVEKAKETYKVFSEYQKALKEKQLYDFSDMIITLLNELESNENLKLDLQEQYQYLLIDEHQDTNDGQNKLIELLTDAEHLNSRPNVFTVGDEKQSIYRFQGASEETFNHFNIAYKDVEVIVLSDNYRSTKDILDSSQSLIVNEFENSIQLQPNTNKSSKIKVGQFSNYKFELLYVVSEIKKLIDSGTDPNEIAIIYRSNKHLDEIKELLNQEKISHIVLSKENILDDPNIQNIINLLKVINNPKDNHSLSKVLFTNFLNFDSYEVTDILEEFNKLNRKGNWSLFNLVNEKNSFKEFIEKLKELKTLSNNSDFSTFFKILLEKVGYLEYMLNAEDSRDQLLKLDKVFDEIKRQTQNSNNYSLSDFVKFVDSYNKYNLDIESNDPEIMEGVRLMTAHKSKGLEFEQVFIIGATSKNWEKSRGFGSISLPIDDYKGSIEDERRLFYVAMTRAKKGLNITSSLTDFEGKEQETSLFVAEINKTFIDEINSSKFEKDSVDDISVFVKNTKASKSIWDKKYLEKRFLEKNISVTSLNNYLSCPIKYLFRNLIQLPSPYTPSLLYGDLIHNSLEKFFRQSKEEKKLLDRKILTGLFEKLIANSSMFGVDYDNYLERGKDALLEYYKKYHKKWILDIDLEKYIRRDFELKNGESIGISGKLDKLEYISENKVKIIDYKTGKPYSEKSSKEQKEDLKRQLIFYHLLLRGDDLSIGSAVLDFVEKNKKGEFEQYSVDVSEKDILDLKKEINTMAEEVLSGEFLDKGCNKKDCEYCNLKI